MELLVSTASLVAGAIENARLYDEMRLRVAELEHLTELAETVAATETLEALGPEVVGRSLGLLGAESVRLYLLDGNEERLRLRWANPSIVDVPATIGLNELAPELGRSGRSPRLTVSLVAGGELLGALVATGTREVDLARAVANQTAVALKKIQVLERLAEKNLIKDFFEDLAARRLGPALEGRAARIGCDLDLPYVVINVEPVDDALERALATLGRGVLLDRREHALRALVPVPQGAPCTCSRRSADSRPRPAAAPRSACRPCAAASPASQTASRRHAMRCSEPASCTAARR